MQSIPLEASLLRRQERLPRCLQPHRAVQPQLPEELSVSPDPGSPQPQSCFQARCLMPPGPPGGLVASQATPLVVRMGASESSPANLAADRLSLSLFPWFQISRCLPGFAFFVFQGRQSGSRVIPAQGCNRYSEGHHVS